MRCTIAFLAGLLALSWCLPALAGAGNITYRARVVHENRSQLSFVSGRIDLTSGDFVETVDHSYQLNWRRMPGAVDETRPSLPDIWEVGGLAAQRFGTAIPRLDSPILRHFIVGRIIGNAEELAAGDSFLAGQLEIGSVNLDRRTLEVVAAFRGMPLVLIGHCERSGGRNLIRDLAVLGPTSELYQYFFDEIEYSARALDEQPELPQFNRADYVTFPAGGASPVAIRPIKDWLVFQAQLPNGRPLNLVFDSGAETMILDELVLKVDALLEPVAELQVAGAFGADRMNLYEGFSFEVGGVRFDNLQVAGTQLTSLGMGAGLRIHGVVGSEILQLTRLDIDLSNGQLLLCDPSEPADPAGHEELPLTFIGRLPHVQVELHGTQSALMMLDTGQRTGLAVNLDWLDDYGMDDQLMLNGFLGDINGGLAPRYIVENLDLDLAGRTYHENAADASPEATFTYNGMPVVGAIGFPLLARHYGNLSFDYSNKLLWLGEPAESREFTGRPEAWDTPAVPGALMLAVADGASGEVEPGQDADYDYAVATVVGGKPDPRRPQLLRDGKAADPQQPGDLSWTGRNGGLLDMLAILRVIPPELVYQQRDSESWNAVDDPRHKPVVLPDRSAFNDEMNERLYGDSAAAPAEDAAGQAVPPVPDFTAAVMAVRLELLSRTLFRLFNLMPPAGVEPAAASSDEDVPPAEESGDRDLGDADKPGDYPFKRGLPRLKFN